MKNTNSKMATVFVVLLLTIMFASCKTDKDEIVLSENEELREDVYQQILNDKKIFDEFMDEMRENEQSMGWMMENRPMMQRAYGNPQMNDMMRSFPDMRHSMMQSMMNMMQQDTAIFNQMHRMMEQDTMMYNRMQMMMQQGRMGGGKMQ